MIDAGTVPNDRMPSTARMIRDEVLKRGWNVWLYYIGSSNMRVRRADGKMLEIFSATPPTTSFVAAYRANDKYFTHVSLHEAGLPVAQTYLVQSKADAVEKAAIFFEQGKRCVVKPLDAGHGNGITVAIADQDMLATAFIHAQEFSKDVVLQEYAENPIDIRVTCINYKHVASLIRVPARVKGDGTHTTGELIDIENAAGHRGTNYIKPLNLISKDRAVAYLGEALHTIPDRDAWVQVLGTANVGTGGETIDVTDALPKWLIEQAEAASRAAMLPVAGIDFLLAAQPTTTATAAELQPVIIEVNKCPSLHIHEFPTHGAAHPAVGAYVDYLATL